MGIFEGDRRGLRRVNLSNSNHWHSSIDGDAHPINGGIGGGSIGLHDLSGSEDLHDVALRSVSLQDGRNLRFAVCRSVTRPRHFYRVDFLLSPSRWLETLLPWAPEVRASRQSVLDYAESSD